MSITAIARHAQGIPSGEVKDRYGEPERGGSEWEPIKILLDGDENSNKTNTVSDSLPKLAKPS
jgi:hypothetical protein